MTMNTDTLPKIDDEAYWLELEQRLVDCDFITTTIDPSNGKRYWKTTSKGIEALDQTLELWANGKFDGDFANAIMWLQKILYPQHKNNHLWT